MPPVLKECASYNLVIDVVFCGGLDVRRSSIAAAYHSPPRRSAAASQLVGLMASEAGGARLERPTGTRDRLMGLRLMSRSRTHHRQTPMRSTRVT